MNINNETYLLYIKQKNNINNKIDIFHMKIRNINNKILFIKYSNNK